jgi:hypothetical protein
VSTLLTKFCIQTYNVGWFVSLTPSYEYRLTTAEELLLLKMCTPSVGYRLPIELVNRDAYVSAVNNIGALPVGKTLSVKVGIDKPPVIENFDSGADTSILDNPKNCMITSKLFGAAYSRPEEVS